MLGGGGGGELCRPCPCCLRGLTSAPGLCCGACPSYPVAVVRIPVVLFLIFVVCFIFYFLVFIYARPFTALCSCVYVLRMFDKTSDVVSYGTVPRTFVQDTRMLGGRHDCLFLWIPDDRHSVAWPCLCRSWFPEAPCP